MAGRHVVCGTPVLVTETPVPLCPTTGDHTLFHKRLMRMFGSEQTNLFSGWLKFALMDYYEFLNQQTGRNVGMGLVVAGSSGLGKSLLLNLVTQCFGGRKAHPAQFAGGKTSFNNDTIRAEIQAFDDEGMGDNHGARKEIGDFVKRTVAVDEQRCHPKGKDAFPVKVFWRLFFSLNDEAENLQVLPPLERGVKDKLMMLKAVGSLLNEAEEHRARHENWSMLLEEMSWFIRWLVEDMNVDETLLDARFGMKYWHHPDLVESVDSFAPEFRLLEMAQNNTYLLVDGVWKGTARELEVALKTLAVTEREAHDLLKSPGSAGKYLGKLAAKRPDLVARAGRDKMKTQLWKITQVESSQVAASVSAHQ